MKNIFFLRKTTLTIISTTNKKQCQTIYLYLCEVRIINEIKQLFGAKKLEIWCVENIEQLNMTTFCYYSRIVKNHIW